VQPIVDEAEAVRGLQACKALKPQHERKRVVHEVPEVARKPVGHHKQSPAANGLVALQRVSVRRGLRPHERAAHRDTATFTLLLLRRR